MGVSNINWVFVALGSVVQVGKGVNVSVGSGVSDGKEVGGNVLVATGAKVGRSVDASSVFSKG